MSTAFHRSGAGTHSRNGTAASAVIPEVDYFSHTPGETTVRAFNGSATVELSVGDVAEHELDGSHGSEMAARRMPAAAFNSKNRYSCQQVPERSHVAVMTIVMPPRAGRENVRSRAVQRAFESHSGMP